MIDTLIPEATPRCAQENGLLAATAHNLAKLTGTITALASCLSARITKPGLAALWVWGLYGAGLLLLTQVGSFGMLCALIVCFGGVKLCKALVYGKYLHNAPNAQRGVLIAVDQTAFWGLATLGTFGMGVLIDMIGLNQTICAVSAVVVSGVLLLAYRGHLAQMTPAWERYSP
ncbi:hypothetical protein [Planktotalea arctica]|uniref:hypothetical protein n=1 Tax=Planktotalea arctica TaxID=1481893 RepID=UPI00111BF313|nr:hypothetical protein [Planktotalea arctica]